MACGTLYKETPYLLKVEITLTSLRTVRVPSGYWALGPKCLRWVNFYTALIDRGRFAWLGDWFCP